MSASAATAEAVRRYFDADAARFDAIYRSDKGLAQRCVDGLFRGVVHRRYELALAWCGDVRGTRVLDVGCGSGRYAVELARRGAEVVGLDLADAMLDMARQAAARAGVEGRCRFEQGDFLEWCAPHHFDTCLGIGFFDYIPAPERFLARMREVTNGRGVFSFPIRWRLRTASRWLRLKLRGCPVFFYEVGQVRQLLAVSGWEGIEVTQLSRDYLVRAQARPETAARVGAGTAELK